MQINIDQLVADMTSAVTSVVKTDATAISGFSKRQLTGIANQASLVAAGIVSGDITDSNRTFFLDQLIALAQNFARTLVGLLLATIEKVWNAIVEVLWKAISSVVGATIPLPNII